MRSNTAARRYRLQRLLVLGVSVGVVGSASVLCAASPAAASRGPGVAVAKYSPPSPNASGWFTYALPSGVNPALTTQRVVQGSPDGSICHFSFSGSIPNAGLQGDEVAFNPSTCQAKYAFGPIQQPDTNPGMSESAASGGGATGATTKSLTRAVPYENAAAYLISWYEDPVGIDVTKLRNDVDWHYAAGCILAYRWTRDAHWYTPTQWELASVNDNPEVTCDHAKSNSQAKMTNSWFCAPFTTFTTYHYAHKIVGRPYGGADYEFDDEKGGGCASLLSHHFTTGHETPWW